MLSPCFWTFTWGITVRSRTNSAAIAQTYKATSFISVSMKNTHCRPSKKQQRARGLNIPVSIISQKLHPGVSFMWVQRPVRTVGLCEMFLSGVLTSWGKKAFDKLKHSFQLTRKNVLTKNSHIWSQSSSSRIIATYCKQTHVFKVYSQQICKENITIEVF